MKPATSNLVCSSGFVKAHHEIPPRRKSGHGLWLDELPKILGLPFNISATAEASGFIIGMQLGFAKAHHKISHRRKGSRGSGLEKLANILGFPFNISATGDTSDWKICMQLGFPRTHYKITSSRKMGMALDLGSSPKFGGSSSISRRRGSDVVL